MANGNNHGIRLGSPAAIDSFLARGRVKLPTLPADKAEKKDTRPKHGTGISLDSASPHEFSVGSSTPDIDSTRGLVNTFHPENVLEVLLRLRPDSPNKNRIAAVIQLLNNRRIGN